MLAISKAWREKEAATAAVMEPAPLRAPRHTRRPSLLPGLLPVLLLVLPTLVAAQSSSNASNFGSGAHVSVSQRTGGLTIQAELFRLDGVIDDVSAALTLTYQSDDVIPNLPSTSAPGGTRFFGLPIGWSMNLSYISDNGSYRNINIDGSQSYAIDSDWRTRFTPAGGTTTFLIPTGMRQYSRADANLQVDAGSVTVNDIPSAFVLANLDGMVRYLSQGGLLLEERDPFGNAIQYKYQTLSGGAVSNFTTPQEALLSSITDSWQHEIVFTYGEDGTVTITLPDSRTVSYVVPNAFELTKIVDAEGKATVLTWTDRACGVGTVTVPSGVTSATGSATSIVWNETCLPVCTRCASPGTNCQNEGTPCGGAEATSWPVVAAIYECPNYAGGACPPSSGGDYLWTSYTFGVGSGAQNYTGYPYFSPYDVTPSWADPLMASNDTSFQYVTRVSRHHTDGSIAYQITSTYNYLHLLIESATSVAVAQPDGSSVLTVSKEISKCYALPGNDGDCPMDEAQYDSLPANYQTPVTVGTCVYNTSPGSSLETARLSVVTRQYDDFGKLLVSKEYHGTGSTGVVSGCSRATRLDPSGLQLVQAEYQAYDTPTVTADGAYVTLGPGARHYGNLTATENFLYLDDDQTSTAPVQVTLTCRTMVGDGANVPAGTAVAESTEGDQSTSAAIPATPGVVEACTSPTFDESVAPPKTSSYSYLPEGRLQERMTTWAGTCPPPCTIDSTSESYAYANTATNAGEESCPGDSSVLQRVRTDPQGHSNTSRTCTLNNFPLSTIDAEGRTVTFAHDALGLTTQITYANGAYTSFDYYYACPTAPGDVATCPSSIASCPYDPQTPARSCVANTLHAGAGNSSYADGVMQATIKDGLGREILTVDNTGGVAGSGYTTQQTRRQQVYDDLGRLTQGIDQIGVSDPLSYTSNTTYDATFRPSIVCDARGNAHQFVHDDVMQEVKLAFNGQQAQQQLRNDSQKLVGLVDCPAVGEATIAGTNCPTIAADTSSATCSGEGYQTAIQRDGAGTVRGITASDPNAASAGASIESLSGAPIYSAQRLKYGYTVSATAAGSNGTGGLTAAGTWKRDLLGRSLQHTQSVTPEGGTSDSFTSEAWSYNNVALLTQESSQLVDSASGQPLTETYEYTPTDKLSQRTSYAGVDFHDYYDSMDRMVRSCYPSGSGSEGETLVRDPISGKVTSVTHFTNPGACSACSDGNCGDTVVSTIRYGFTPFGAITTKTYTDSSGTTTLQWGHDAYQRVVCFADAAATAAGSVCPASPVPSDFAPSADEQLTSMRYYPQSDPYRRGLLQSSCRGVPEMANGSLTFVTQCIDTDYYTSVDTGGSCDASLESATGTFAGETKTRTLCRGASCAAGGTPVYQTTYLYDPYRRRCAVTSRTCANGECTSTPVIVAETYTHDQYGNVITETHQSDLDSTLQSNNRITYTYDGLMRVLTAVRDDLDGNLIESTTYTYDAASNILSKVQQIAFTPTPTESPTSGPTATPTIATVACAGDCTGNGEVTVDDLMKGVNIALGILPIDDCAAFDADADGTITIAELIVGVNNALSGCGLPAAH